jgi:hypothetical protein
MLSQGQDVPVGTTGADDEIIRKRTKLGYLQEHRLDALVGDDGLDG